MLKTIKDSRVRNKNRRLYTLVDLKKAYDSVDRNKLLDILLKRVHNDSDFHLLQLIKLILKPNVISFGNAEVNVNKGVPQGSSLSPFLFNIYLENALLNNPLLEKGIKEGKIWAFADDILLISKSTLETEQLIEAISGWGDSHALFLNKDKSHLISDIRSLGELKDIGGIKREKRVK